MLDPNNKKDAHSKVVALLLLIHFLLLLPLFVCFFSCVWSLFCNTLLSVMSSFAIISIERERESWLRYFNYVCQLSVNVLCLFLMVPCVGLQFVIFHCLTHLRFDA